MYNLTIGEDTFIRENITPRGDGNSIQILINKFFSIFIRENITPRGDGN